jgi:hypothetical protein
VDRELEEVEDGALVGEPAVCAEDQPQRGVDLLRAAGRHTSGAALRGGGGVRSAKEI